MPYLKEGKKIEKDKLPVEAKLGAKVTQSCKIEPHMGTSQKCIPQKIEFKMTFSRHKFYEVRYRYCLDFKYR
jgi:hypothetical protein